MPSTCLCALSQKGSWAVNPQLHQEYTLPGCTRMPMGSQAAMRGSPSWGMVSITNYLPATN